MLNRILRHTNCANCNTQLPVYEYGLPGTMGDSGFIVILKNGSKTNIGQCCWNKLVNDHIQFGPRGWEWVEPVLTARMIR